MAQDSAMTVAAAIVPSVQPAAAIHRQPHSQCQQQQEPAVIDHHLDSSDLKALADGRAMSEREPGDFLSMTMAAPTRTTTGRGGRTGFIDLGAGSQALELESQPTGDHLLHGKPRLCIELQRRFGHLLDDFETTRRRPIRGKGLIDIGWHKVPHDDDGVAMGATARPQACSTLP